ncbi:MAG: prepilin-type N-terminal cleavage/methylation domain-containing protein [Elusimicrobiales bacterium]|nr:prepilin-type N-terminal cleavage/methylation domain-containing protein [Elusimicrobiales bacterium]
MKRNGFTLLEMLTVTAIIAVLGTVAVTRYGASVKKAKAAECAATRYIVTDAEKRFMIEHEGKASKSLEELRDTGYIQALPVCNAGGTFAWVMDADNKARHLACSLHGDAMPDAPPTIPVSPPGSVTPPAPGKPPASAADCPPGTDFIRVVQDKTAAYICAPKCPAGQLHHPITGVCLTPVSHPGAAHYCPPGWHWSAQHKKCDPNNPNSPKPKACSGGRTWDEAAGECLTPAPAPAQPAAPVTGTCPRMWKWDDLEKHCRPNAAAAAAAVRIMDMPKECPGNTNWDKASQQCK